jgi:hypothetical protein
MTVFRFICYRYPVIIEQCLGWQQLDAVYLLAIKQRPSWQLFGWLEHNNGI